MTSWAILKKPREDDKVQKGRPSGDLGRHERETYAKVHLVVIQSAITEEVESIDSGEQVSHRNLMNI